MKNEDKMVKECMTKWAKNLRYNIALSEWGKLWEMNIKITKTASYKEDVYKLFYRWHFTSLKLAKMYSQTNKCWKCNKAVDLLWTCEKAKKCGKKCTRVYNISVRG